MQSTLDSPAILLSEVLKMQAVIAIPSFTAPIGEQTAAELLTRKVAGVPLLRRIILTASRAGAKDILLVCREAMGTRYGRTSGKKSSQLEVASGSLNSANSIRAIHQAGRRWRSISAISSSGFPGTGSLASNS
jgi:hypothetical protein